MLCTSFRAGKAEKLLAEAAALGSQIVVFPEAFIGGYPRGSVFASNSNGPITNGVEQFSKYVAAAIQVPGNQDSGDYLMISIIFYPFFLPVNDVF